MTIFVWKEVYVVGQVDADSSGESDDSESDNVKRRDRRGYIDTISNPAYFFANHESKFVLKMKWVINQIRIKSLCQLLFLIVIQFFPTRIELSNNLRMRSKFHFILFFHSKRKDERCNIQSLQHLLGNLHSFLYSLDEIRLADIKFKRFQQAFQFIKLPENVHLPKISCV